MAGYIKRGALVARIDTEREKNKQKANNQLDLYGIGYNNGLAMAATLVITAPDADFEPVERCDGCRWKGKRHQRCSCCRRNQYLKDGYEEG